MIPDDVSKKHIERCNRCKIRAVIARTVDMHFDWLDCPYECDNDYEHYIAADKGGDAQ